MHPIAAFVIGIIAGAIVGGLIEWLLDRILPALANWKHITAVVASIVVLLGVMVWLTGPWQTPSVAPPTPSPAPPVSYLIRVIDDTTGASIARARVTLELGGRILPIEVTDDNGLARFLLNVVYDQEPGRLLVNAGGYHPHRETLTIDISGDNLTVTVLLRPLSSETTTPTQAAGNPSVTASPAVGTVGVCGGTAVALPVPSGPENFNVQFGFTIYNTGNSFTTATGGLLGNVVRSLLVDDQGIWIGYGSSPDSYRGVSYLTSPAVEGKRMWEACTTLQGGSIGRHVNAITKDNRGRIWVATDGDGVWVLENSTWTQFAEGENLDTGLLPDRAAFTVSTYNNLVYAGTLEGVMQYNGIQWSNLEGVDQTNTHAIAFAGNGDTWVGFTERGIRQIRADGSTIDHNIANGSLTSNAIRSVVIDNKQRVWVATKGGGVHVWEQGSWKVFTANRDGLASDNVQFIAIDKVGRIWAATDKGVSYYDDTMWHLYSSYDTYAVGFGSTAPERCQDAVDVWTGTNGNGLTHSRVPSPTRVITDVSIEGVSEPVSPGQEFSPTITITLEQGYALTEGDFLLSIGESSYTSNPTLPPDLSRVTNSSYTFSFANNTITAPTEPGKYESTWRLWQCGRYVGDPIVLTYSVKSP